MKTVFLAYRRSDTAREVTLLREKFEKLLLEQAKIFRDIESLEVGATWLRQIDSYLQKGDICFVVIGHKWLVDDQGTPRQFGAEDVHRQEIEWALNRGLTVIPLTVNHAPLPSRTDLPPSIQDLLNWQSYNVEIAESGEIAGVEKLIERINTLIRLDISPAQPGERVGTYQLVQKIHQSGETEVWKAQPVNGTGGYAPLRCLKFLTAQRLVTADRVTVAERWRQLFERTHAIPREQFSHLQHLCEVVDFVDDKYRGPGLVMPLINGTNLHAHRIAQCGTQGFRLSTAVKEYLWPVASALDHLHRAGWIYRNLQPKNLMLEFKGKASTPWLIDPSQMTPFTVGADGQDYLGTTGYRAPEQAHGDPQDGRADIYALAITVGEVLTGVHPFFGSDPTDWRSPERSLRTWLSHLRMTDTEYLGEKSVQAIIQKGLALRPADRFSTCREFLQEFYAAASKQKKRVHFEPDVEGKTKSDHGGVSEGQAAGERRLFGDLDFPFRWCPPGRFCMGSPETERDRGADECGPDGKPIEVKLPRGMWVGETLISNIYWQLVMNDQFGQQLLQREFPAVGEQEQKARDQWPALFIPWDLAREFCRRLTIGGQEAGWLPKNWHVTLPTETQWEYAARAGSTAATPFGPSLGSDRANFNGNFPYGKAPQGRFLGRPVPVNASAAVNAWGLRDMIGNAYEWCLDRYHSRLGSVEPLDSRGDAQYVARGGAWCTAGVYCRSAARAKFSPFDRLRHVGLRVIIVRTD